MKKMFFLGVMTGCFFSSMALLGYLFMSEDSTGKPNTSPLIQQQIATEISNAKQLVEFAENSLASYSDCLHKVRELMLQSAQNDSSKKTLISEIHRVTDEGLLTIESAKFNSIPIFYGDNGEYFRTIPVTLDSTTPTYKITISSENFSRKVVDNYIRSLESASIQSLISDLDSILSAVSLERSRLDAYQRKLAYSYKATHALSKENEIERTKELKSILSQIENDQVVLSIKSANGIYTSNDRKQIQIQFDELHGELVRIHSILTKSLSNKTEKNASLLTQQDAERTMLYLVDLES